MRNRINLHSALKTNLKTNLIEKTWKKLTSFQKCEPYKSWKAQEKRNKDSSVPKHGQQKMLNGILNQLIWYSENKSETKINWKNTKKADEFSEMWAL